MASDVIKTSVLYQVDNHKVFISEYNNDEKEAINELLSDGFLRLVANNLQLTDKGNFIIKFNGDYKSEINQPLDAKRIIRPPKTQEQTHPIKTSHEGIGAVKKLFKAINENIWLATVIGGLLLYFIIVFISKKYGIKP